MQQLRRSKPSSLDAATFTSLMVPFTSAIKTASDANSKSALVSFLADPQLLLGQHPSSVFGTNNERPTDSPVRVTHRTIAVGPVHVVEFAVAKNWNQLVFVPGGFTP